MQQATSPYLIKSQPTHTVDNRTKIILDEVCSDAFNYIRNYADIHNPGTYIIQPGNEFELLGSYKPRYKYIVYLEPIETRNKTNSIIKNINEKLKNNGLFIGRYMEERHPNMKLINKNNYPDFIYRIQNIFQLNNSTNSQKKNPFNFSRKNLKIKMNLFGRFYYFGFEIISEKTIGYHHYFVAKKTEHPSEKALPSASPFIKLKRVGKNGKIISIYKLRTMYPYSEYLQEYIFKNNQLESGGKFNDDYRIIRIGNLLRKYWIDEIPMIINLLKGEIKLFGVRPLSQHYFNLYSEELKEFRIKFKPGLIPPYYVDLPNSFEAILHSEMKYLNEYQNSPFWTDFKYLLKALYNILIRCKRSK